MSTAADSSKNENESTYVINAEDAAESDFSLLRSALTRVFVSF
jgi:hypothetical protein